MRLYNPYTRIYIEYPVDFDIHILSYHIKHETPFTDKYSEWAVSILENGDTIYMPYGNNRCTDIYIVTRYHKLPHGIYTIPFSYFTRG